MATQQKKTAKPNAANAAPPNSSGGSKWIFPVILIVVVTFFSLSPVMKNGFINQDDGIYVYQDTNLSNPLPEAISFFFGPHYFSGNYIPLTMTVYALEYSAAGTAPGYYHTVNLLIHLANVLLVFWFIYLLSRKKPLVASIVALFFGIHPMHVESVAWVAELKDMLYTFFFIAGLIAYYKYIEQKDKKNKLGFPVIVFILFALAVLSKPAAIIFPIVLLLLDFYTGRKFDKSTLIEKLPFFIISFIFGIIAIKAQQADNLISNNYSFLQRLFFASSGLLTYMLKLFLPVHLSAFYPYPPFVNGHLPYMYYAAPVVVAILFYGIYKTLKFTRIIAFGFCFFVINVFLVLQLLSIGNAIIADRYTYVSYIGLFYIIAIGFDWLYNSRNPKLISFKPFFLTIIIASAVTFSYLTYQRCEVWQNENTMATDILDKFPDDRIALNNKGFILYKLGNYQEAIKLFTKAIEVKPDYIMANINLVNSYIALKNYDDALKIATNALKYEPQNYDLLTVKGNILSRLHQYPEAIRLYETAIPLEKDNTNVYIHLSNCYFALHDYESSLKTLNEALKYDPQNYFLLNNKGYILFTLGKYSEALACYKASLAMKPDFTTARVNLSQCYSAINDSSKIKN